MSRHASPEEEATSALDKTVGRLLGDRRWKGEWELFDDRSLHRVTYWEWFHNRPNTRISAITPVIINDGQWWIVAHYENRGTFAEFVAFGLFSTPTSRNRASIQFCNVDPRTLGKHVADYINHPDGYVRRFIRSREDMTNFLAEI